MFSHFHFYNQKTGFNVLHQSWLPFFAPMFQRRIHQVLTLMQLNYFLCLKSKSTRRANVMHLFTFQTLPFLFALLFFLKTTGTYCLRADTKTFLFRKTKCRLVSIWLDFCDWEKTVFHFWHCGKINEHVRNIPWKRT